MFSNFQEGFSLISSTDFAHTNSHIKSSEYESIFGIKISLIMFEKSWSLWRCVSEQANIKKNLQTNKQIVIL